ncbi:hypothetical protein [Lactococcus lactis]|uniref:hypothetical protein n=1 Tax=Lactococcus lactis TaxID=1358 RepID=UPI0019114667|nr:hypothetical protein [Lactococcus lactis]WDA68465.1 hypothetical protein IL310_13195 [Lactococcus lactis]
MKKNNKKYPKQEMKEYFFHQKRKIVIFDMLVFLSCFGWSLFHKNSGFIILTGVLYLWLIFLTAWLKFRAIESGKIKSSDNLLPWFDSDSYLLSFTLMIFLVLCL